MVTRHQGRFTPDDRAASTWHSLPFDVPVNCPGIEVRLEYERIGAVLDLGCVGPDGWRGWSGGARSRFVITAAAATPGYLPGLTAGSWQVVLGLHRVPPHGASYEVVVSTDAGVEPAAEPAVPPVPAPRPRRSFPAPDGLHWYAGDLHAHTTHSDGALTVDELAVLAAAQGLDFCAVTDHNTVSHHRFLAAAGARAGVTLLPGQEVTTDSGHANAFGDIGWIDFREPAQHWVDEVAGRGGLLSVNHPVGGDCAWRKRTATPPPLAEVWHGSWSDRRDGATLAWWAARDYAPIPVGGCDWHFSGAGSTPGTPTTWVAATDPSVPAILDGLRAGRTAISADRDGPVLLRDGDELVCLDGEGAVLLDADGRRRVVPAPYWKVAAANTGPYVLETADRVALALCR